MSDHRAHRIAGGSGNELASKEECPASIGADTSKSSMPRTNVTILDVMLEKLYETLKINDTPHLLNPKKSAPRPRKWTPKNEMNKAQRLRAEFVRNKSAKFETETLPKPKTSRTNYTEKIIPIRDKKSLVGAAFTTKRVSDDKLALKFKASANLVKEEVSKLKIKSGNSLTKTHTRPVKTSSTQANKLSWLKSHSSKLNTVITRKTNVPARAVTNITTRVTSSNVTPKTSKKKVSTLSKIGVKLNNATLKRALAVKEATAERDRVEAKYAQSLRPNLKQLYSNGRATPLHKTRAGKNTVSSSERHSIYDRPKTAHVLVRTASTQYPSHDNILKDRPKSCAPSTTRIHQTSSPYSEDENSNLKPITSSPTMSNNEQLKNETISNTKLSNANERGVNDPVVAATCLPKPAPLGKASTVNKTKTRANSAHQTVLKHAPFGKASTVHTTTAAENKAKSIPNVTKPTPLGTTRGMKVATGLADQAATAKPSAPRALSSIPKSTTATIDSTSKLPTSATKVTATPCPPIVRMNKAQIKRAEAVKSAKVEREKKELQLATSIKTRRPQTAAYNKGKKGLTQNTVARDVSTVKPSSADSTGRNTERSDISHNYSGSFEGCFDNTRTDTFPFSPNNNSVSPEGLSSPPSPFSLIWDDDVMALNSSSEKIKADQRPESYVSFANPETGDKDTVSSDFSLTPETLDSQSSLNYDDMVDLSSSSNNILIADQKTREDSKITEYLHDLEPAHYRPIDNFIECDEVTNPGQTNQLDESQREEEKGFANVSEDGSCHESRTTSYQQAVVSSHNYIENIADPDVQATLESAEQEDQPPINRRLSRVAEIKERRRYSVAMPSARATFDRDRSLIDTNYVENMKDPDVETSVRSVSRLHQARNQDRRISLIQEDRRDWERLSISSVQRLSPRVLSSSSSCDQVNSSDGNTSWLPTITSRHATRARDRPGCSSTYIDHRQQQDSPSPSNPGSNYSGKQKAKRSHKKDNIKSADKYTRDVRDGFRVLSEQVRPSSSIVRNQAGSTMPPLALGSQLILLDDVEWEKDRDTDNSSTHSRERSSSGRQSSPSSFVSTLAQAPVASSRRRSTRKKRSDSSKSINYQ